MRSPAIASDPAPVGMTRFGFDTMKLLTVKPERAYLTMKPRFVNCVTDLKLHGGGAKAGLTLFLSSRYTS